MTVGQITNERTKGTAAMTQSTRLSRLTKPRTSLVAMALLALVFGLFGLITSALHPELGIAAPGALPPAFEGVAALFNNWTLGN
jgi:hypothetical protein